MERTGYRRKWVAPYKRKWAKRNAGSKYVRKTVSGMLRAAGVSRPEVRHNYFEVLGTAVSSTLTTAGQLLGPSGQGADEGQVVGFSYKAQRIRGRIFFQNTSTTNQHVARIMVVEDLAGSLAQLVPYNAAASYGYLLFESNNAMSLVRPDSRFKVLHDKAVHVSASGSGAQNEVLHEFSLWLGNAHVKNEHPVSSSTLYATNRAYYLWVICDTSGVVSCSIFTDFQYIDV